MEGVDAYMDAHQDTFDEATRKVLTQRLADKRERYNVKGNAWQKCLSEAYPRLPGLVGPVASGLSGDRPICRASL